MSIKDLMLGAMVAAVTAGSTVSAAASPLELSVRTGHVRHASWGTLVFGDQGVEYRTAKKNAGRHWTYEQIRQIQVSSPTRIVVRTYEDQGFRLWTDRSVEFDVEKGAVTPDLAAFLLSKMARPVVTSVLPAPTGAPLFSVPVKHVRGRGGSAGVLRLYANALVYESARKGASRYWRFPDLASVSAPNRFRLDVLTYEGGDGDTRPFTFQLETDLPAGFYDALWEFVNGPPALEQTIGR